MDEGDHRCDMIINEDCPVMYWSLSPVPIGQTSSSAEERVAVGVEGSWALPAGSAEHEKDVPGGSARPRWPQRVQHAVRDLTHTQTHMHNPFIIKLLTVLMCPWPVCRYHNGDAYIIDVSQSVEHDHPHALEFLRKDCSNVSGQIVFSVWKLCSHEVKESVDEHRWILTLSCECILF